MNLVFGHYAGEIERSLSVMCRKSLARLDNLEIIWGSAQLRDWFVSVPVAPQLMQLHGIQQQIDRKLVALTAGTVLPRLGDRPTMQDMTGHGRSLE